MLNLHFMTNGGSPVRQTITKHDQLMSKQLHLLSNQMNSGLHGLNLVSEPKTIPTPLSIKSKQPANNRRYFSALSAADTFNSFNNSNKQSQAQMAAFIQSTNDSQHRNQQNVSFKNARRSNNGSQAANAERVKSRYKNNNTQIQPQSHQLQRAFNVSLKNGKIPNKQSSIVSNHGNG